MRHRLYRGLQRRRASADDSSCRRGYGGKHSFCSSHGSLSWFMHHTMRRRRYSQLRYTIYRSNRRRGQVSAARLLGQRCCITCSHSRSPGKTRLLRHPRRCQREKVVQLTGHYGLGYQWSIYILVLNQTGRDHADLPQLFKQTVRKSAVPRFSQSLRGTIIMQPSALSPVYLLVRTDTYTTAAVCGFPRSEDTRTCAFRCGYKARWQKEYGLHGVCKRVALRARTPRRYPKTTRKLSLAPSQAQQQGILPKIIAISIQFETGFNVQTKTLAVDEVN